MYTAITINKTCLAALPVVR